MQKCHGRRGDLITGTKHHLVERVVRPLPFCMRHNPGLLQQVRGNLRPTEQPAREQNVLGDGGTPMGRKHKATCTGRVSCVHMDRGSVHTDGAWVNCARGEGGQGVYRITSVKGSVPTKSVQGSAAYKFAQGGARAKSTKSKAKGLKHPAAPASVVNMPVSDVHAEDDDSVIQQQMEEAQR